VKKKSIKGVEKSKSVVQRNRRGSHGGQTVASKEKEKMERETEARGKKKGFEYRGKKLGT